MTAAECRRTLPSDSGSITLPHRKSRNEVVAKRPESGVIAMPELQKKFAVLSATVGILRKEVAALKAARPAPTPAPTGLQLEGESSNSVRRYNPDELNVTC